MVSTRPRVLAIVVATDGAGWLPEVMEALGAQTYRPLDVVAVDNGSRDGSRDILLETLPEDRVLVSERDLGFPGAVAMALDAHHEGELVLLVHDDLALAPDAVEHLVARLAADPVLAVVGPKLVDWDDPRRLLAVGWTIDVTGRPDYGLEPDERDQGQHDDPRRTLAVSTAGMLVRRDVLEGVGRFDRRYHLFREDLDLCWRVWLAGFEVEAVPRAVARHRRAAAEYHRLGQALFLGPRYFAERNTFATLLKNYSGPRVAVIAPLFLVIGILKVLAFLATRRVGDAWQATRAWVWNGLHLRHTRHLRREVQAMRRRTDAELAGRFARVGPRARAYAEAIADRITGGDLAVTPEEREEDDQAPPATVTARVVATVRDHPVGSVALLLFVAGVVIAAPLLPAGAIRGGEVAAFPASSGVLFEDYVASWHDAGSVGTASAPSPAQALLGVLQWLLMGSPYLASRALLLGVVPAAWLLSLRAVRPLAPTRGPRVAAATLYALSPAALAAVRTGTVGGLVLLVAIPAFVSAMHVALRRDAVPSAAWRGTAASVLVAGVAIAFEPAVAVGVAVAHLLGLLVVLLRSGPRGRRRREAARVGVMTVGTVAVLFPWSLDLVRPDGPLVAGPAQPDLVAEPLWRWLLQAPDAFGYPGFLAGGGMVAAGILGLLFAARRRGVAALFLWGIVLVGAVLATVLSRAGTDAWTSPVVPLLATSAALATLFALGLRALAPVLSEHDFGWRQVGAGMTVAAAVVGAAASLWGTIDDQWSALAVGQDALPAFVTAGRTTEGVPAETADHTGDYRVLVVAEDQGVVSWDVTTSRGPTLADLGVTPPANFASTVDGVLAAALSGSNPGAVARLALLNVRYLVVPEGGRTDTLERALTRQLDLEPRPVATGLVYEVARPLPRVAWIPAEAADVLEERGALPSGALVQPLEPVAPNRYAGAVPGRGVVLISEAEIGAWQVELSDGTELRPRLAGGVVLVEIPAEARELVVEHGQQTTRTLAVVLQVLAILLVVSLVLRPPAFATEGPP